MGCRSDKLVDGEKMDASISEEFARLPVVRTGQGFIDDGTKLGEMDAVKSKTHTGKKDVQESDVFVQDDDGNYSFNPGGF